MQSIVATFENFNQAQQALEQLVKEGYDRAAIHLQTAADDQQKAAASASASTSNAMSLVDPFGFANVFSALFGQKSGSAPGKSEAGKHAEAVRRGHAVLVLDAEDEEVDRAISLVVDLGAIDMDQRSAEWESQGWKGFDAAAALIKPDQVVAAESADTVLPVVQEELHVGKRAVQGGGVRVVKKVTETPVAESVTLREEHAVFERRPVDRAATETDFKNFEEGVVEVLEMSEEAVISKSARVVEEVVVGKEVTQRTQEVSDTVRRTDVDVERVPAQVTKTKSAGPTEEVEFDKQ